MKFYTLLFLVVSVVCTQANFAGWSDKEKQKAYAISEECRTETVVKKSTIEQIAQNHKFVKDDPNLNFYLRCMETKVGLTDKEGNVDQKALERKLKASGLDNDKIKKVKKTCVKRRDYAKVSLIECVITDGGVPNFHIVA